MIPAASRKVVFVCLHGSAKSLIAAEHLNRIATVRGLGLYAESLGVEPDPGVPAAVVAGLATDGIDVRDYVPRPATSAGFADARHVVAFGCDVSQICPREVEQWADLPMVSDGFPAARDAIVARVTSLLDRLENHHDES